MLTARLCAKADRVRMACFDLERVEANELLTFIHVCVCALWERRVDRFTMWNGMVVSDLANTRASLRSLPDIFICARPRMHC